MNFDIVEVVIDKLIRTFRLREWQYDIEEIVEDIAEALKLIGAAKLYAEKVAVLTVNNMVAKIPRDCDHIKHLDPKNLYYRESGNFIEVDLSDGTEVNITYQAIPTDVRGFPLVPDNAAVREAIMWYLVKVLVLQGEVKTVPWEKAEAEWQWRCGSARADLNVLNLQQTSRIYNDFVRLNPIKDIHLKNYSEMGKANTLDRTNDTSKFRNL